MADEPAESAAVAEAARPKYKIHPEPGRENENQGDENQNSRAWPVDNFISLHGS